MRLRNEHVEYRVCSCRFIFEGDGCPECRIAFDPAIHRTETRRRIIVVSHDIDAVYERNTDRVRCPQDRNLYDPVESRIRNWSHAYIEWKGTDKDSIKGCGEFLFPGRELEVAKMSNAKFRETRNAMHTCPRCCGATSTRSRRT